MELLFASGSDARAAQQIRMAYCRLGLSLSHRGEAKAHARARIAIKKLQEQLRHRNYLTALLGRAQAENEALRAELKNLQMGGRTDALLKVHPIAALKQKVLIKAQTLIRAFM